MSEVQRPVPKWILIVSGLFTLIELMASIMLFMSPDSLSDRIDHTAKGVDYVIYMWAVRQFALCVIFAFATLKRSSPMLTLVYIFFIVMFAGDFVIGMSQNDNALMFGGLVMFIISSLMLIAINKKR